MGWFYLLACFVFSASMVRSLLNAASNSEISAFENSEKFGMASEKSSENDWIWKGPRRKERRPECISIYYIHIVDY